MVLPKSKKYQPEFRRFGKKAVVLDSDIFAANPPQKGLLALTELPVLDNIRQGLGRFWTTRNLKKFPEMDLIGGFTQEAGKLEFSQNINVVDFLPGTQFGTQTQEIKFVANKRAFSRETFTGAIRREFNEKLWEAYILGSNVLAEEKAAQINALEEQKMELERLRGLLETRLEALRRQAARERREAEEAEARRRFEREQERARQEKERQRREREERTRVAAEAFEEDLARRRAALAEQREQEQQEGQNEEAAALGITLEQLRILNNAPEVFRERFRYIREKDPNYKIAKKFQIDTQFAQVQTSPQVATTNMLRLASNVQEALLNGRLP